jgi:drug/metabolite transporter (DMT)-like permease
MISAVVYALLSSFFHALHVVILTPILKQGVSPRIAALYTLAIGTLITGIASFLTLPFLCIMLTSPLLPILLLVFSGLLGQGLARTANYYSVKFIGAARGNLLVNSAPLFALPVAFTILGEVFSINKIIGAILLMTAIVLTSKEAGKIKGEEYSSGGASKIGVLLGILAAILYAVARLLRKVVVDFLPYPLLTSFIANGVAIPLVLLEEKQSSAKSRVFLPSLYALPLSLAGCLQVLGIIMEFMAYGVGEASIVIPARSTTPIFTAFLSLALLKKYEKITPYSLIACFIAVLGIVILSL